MHILLIHQAFASLDEAGGTRHMEMARILVEEGYKITVITSSISYLTGKSSKNVKEKSTESAENSEISIRYAYTYPALHRSFFHRIISFLSFMVSSFFAGLDTRGVDLVWGTSPPIFQGATAWLLAKLKKVPFLFEVRDLWPEFAIAIGVLKNPFLINLALWLEKYLYNQADMVMVNSPGFLEHVSGKGVKKLALIPNGVDLDFFKEPLDGSFIRKQYGWGNKFVVMYAGAHGISNDLEVLLQAALILNDTKDIIFALVGDGKEKNYLLEEAARNQLKQVVFLPPVPKLEISSVLSAADVCVAILKPLDLYKTTLPNKVFDYMACSRPVILAIDGVIRGIVEDAHAGVFSSPGDPASLADAVRYLYSHRDIGKRMGKSGRMYVDLNYNRKMISQQFMEVLSQLSNSRSK